MTRNSSERCQACGAPALVRMQGDTLCARCGLERSSGPEEAKRKRTRAVLLGLFSSGFLAKMLVGAVAVAAVGGVAAGVAAEPRSRPAQTPTTTASFVQADAPTPQTTAPDGLLQRVQEYADDVRAWGDCVSAAAQDHTAGAFDPKAACGETPTASDLGLDDGRPPLQDKAEDKITKTADKAEDKATKTADKADQSGDE